MEYCVIFYARMERRNGRFRDFPFPLRKSITPCKRFRSTTFTRFEGKRKPRKVYRETNVRLPITEVNPKRPTETEFHRPATKSPPSERPTADNGWKVAANGADGRRGSGEKPGLPQQQLRPANPTGGAVSPPQRSPPGSSPPLRDGTEPLRGAGRRTKAPSKSGCGRRQRLRPHRISDYL